MALLQNRAEVEIKWVPSETVTDESVDDLLKDVSGILVPGGFGDRGIEGKIRAVQYARKIKFHSLVFALECSLLS